MRRSSAADASTVAARDAVTCASRLRSEVPRPSSDSVINACPYTTVSAVASITATSTGTTTRPTTRSVTGSASKVSPIAYQISLHT